MSIVVQSLSHVWLFATPWIAACQVSVSFTVSRCLIKLTAIESVMPSNYLILSSPSPPAFNLFQHQGLFQWVVSSHQVAKRFELQLQHQSFWWAFRVDFLSDWLVWSPCRPRDSQDSPRQIQNINSLALSLLYGSTPISLHHYWKTIAWLCRLLLPKWCLCFLICCLGLSKEKVYFNCMSAFMICSDSGAQENKICHCFHFPPIYLPWGDGTGCHDLSKGVVLENIFPS